MMLLRLLRLRLLSLLILQFVVFVSTASGYNIIVYPQADFLMWVSASDGTGNSALEIVEPLGLPFLVGHSAVDGGHCRVRIIHSTTTASISCFPIPGARTVVA